jgi:hypothetical protein
VPLTLNDVRRVAAEVAREVHPALEVVGAAPARGEPTYTEVVLTLIGCRVEPCRMSIGLSRDQTELEFRAAVAERLRHHFEEHHATHSTR